MTGSAISIRRARHEDGPALIRLIIALAQFEKLTPPHGDAQGRLLEDGFGERPRFETWLAYCGDMKEPVGYALIFETYSSFLARPTLYLEDVFVLPEHRGAGIGSRLLRHCIGLAHQRGCGRMEWTCLDWNTRAQSFYDALGARKLSEWHLYRLTRETIDRLAAGNAP